MESILSVALWFAACCLLFWVAEVRARSFGRTLVAAVSVAPTLLASSLAAGLEGASGISRAFPSLLALSCATVCAVTDMETGYVFDAVTMLSLFAVQLAACARGELACSIAGTATCGGALCFMHFVTRGRGIGLGDAKLAAVVGAGLGTMLGTIALGLAFVLGAAAVSFGLVRKTIRVGQSIPFAPFLTGATIVCLAMGANGRG